MFTDEISTIQQFVKNGGRYKKGKEPAYGEPFYGKYMEQLIKKDYELGDKIQIEMDNGKVYSGLLMRNAWYYMDLLVSGSKIWKSGQNLKAFNLNNIKTLTLIEKRNPEFDMDKADPEYLCHKRENEDGVDYSNVDTNGIETRNKNKAAFEKVYPDVSFDDSHVICIENGCSLFFPFTNGGVSAEVYLVQKNGMNAKKIECKVGRPYPNKCSYHAYNSKDKEYNDVDLYTYLPDANAEYHDVYIVCVWTVDMTADYGKDLKFVQMYEIGTIEPQVGKKNTHFITMRISSICGHNDLFTKEHQYELEKIMDRKSVFFLDIVSLDSNCEALASQEPIDVNQAHREALASCALDSVDDAYVITSLKESDDEDSLCFLAEQALSHFNIKEMLQSLMIEKVLDEYIEVEHIEVTVDYEDVSPGYFSGDHRKGRKGYQLKMLKN